MTHPAWIDQKALEVARRFTLDTESQWCAALQCAVIEAMLFARPDLAQAPQAAEPVAVLTDAAVESALRAWHQQPPQSPDAQRMRCALIAVRRAPHAPAAQPLTVEDLDDEARRQAETITRRGMFCAGFLFAEKVYGIAPSAQGEQTGEQAP